MNTEDEIIALARRAQALPESVTLAEIQELSIAVMERLQAKVPANNDLN